MWIASPGPGLLCTEPDRHLRVQLRRFYFQAIVRTARACSAFLRRVGLDTHDTLQSLRLFRKALRLVDLTGMTVDAQGAHFYCENMDLISVKIALVGAHEYDVTEFMLKHLEADTVFIDVGANVGYYSVIAATRLRSGRVVSIEPFEESAFALEKNLRLNRSKNATVVRKIVWHKSGVKINLHIPDDSNLGSNSILGEGPMGIGVESVALDDLLFELGVQCIDILKIDVEGAEREVILGMERCFRESRPLFIVCAFDHPESGVRRETYDMLLTAGYEEIDLHTEACVVRTDIAASNLLFRDRRGRRLVRGD
jgi:FkbM family methyltransferase